MNINKLMGFMYLESEGKYTSDDYRPKNWTLSFIWVICSLLINDKKFSGNIVNLKSASNVSFCFFANEYVALKKQELEPYNINLRKLGFLRSIGLLRLIKATLMFIKHHRKSNKSWHIQYVAFILHFYFLSFFKNTKIKTVTVASIWQPCSLAIVLAAREFNIKVRYVEHAVTPISLMRYLNFYDYAVVEHKFTKLLLEERCDSIQVSLKSRLDKRAIPIPKGIKKVSVCVNILDSSADMYKLIDYLDKLGLIVDVRFHLADKRFDSFVTKYKNKKIVVSHSRDCLFEKYVKHYDLVIAGNSNVISDCIVHEVSCLYYWNGVQELYDYYGVVDYYKITVLDDFSVLNEYL